MTPIDVLPDDVLLAIFDFCIARVGYQDKREIEAWQSLVHVCQRWRTLVFQSARRLNLQLYLTPQTPTKDKLDVWPALPLLIRGNMDLSSTDNVIAALGQRSRVHEINLCLAGWKVDEVLAPMQVPFPELTDLQLFSFHETPPAIPDSFLGGSAPRLRSLTLNSISFPGLPKLLLSATQLVHLSLEYIPLSGYISPEAIVATLFVLSSLETLHLRFESPESRPDRESPSHPPPKRFILPALREFYFKGVTEYLEQVMTGIDTPQLYRLHIDFLNQIDFHCPRLAQFINCTPSLIRPLNEVRVRFHNLTASIRLRPRFGIDNLLININIPCGEPNRQLSSIEQVFNTSFHPFSTVEDLYIEHPYSQLVWTIEDTPWLELLLPFTAVKNLYLSEESAPGIAAALQELVGDRVTEVLPSLQNIFVEELELSGAFRESVGQFIATRQLSKHPIAVSEWFPS